MKTIVIYMSKTGFTRKYAEWIANDLNADMYDISKVNVDMLADYDTVIYGGSLHAVGIIGVKFITVNIGLFKDKKVVVFATGATPPREADINEVRNKNFTAQQLKYIKFFYLRGGFDYSKLNLFDKFLMTLLKLKLKMKKELTPDERGMLASYNKPVDFASKKNIDEIIAYVNS